MKTAIRELIAARNRSVAYIKSGWLQAIRILSAHADKRNAPRKDSEPKQYGQAKGAAYFAGKGAKVAVATIINEAYAKRDTKDALTKVGSRGLQRAFSDEASSMQDYIKRKISEAAKEFNAEAK